MGFIVKDLADENKVLKINIWNWHPTVELIESFGIIDAERIERMHMQLGAAKITEAEARQIGQRLQADVIPRLRSDDRVLLDGSVTDEPDDGVMHYDDTSQNYSASPDG
jgi:hypothetical protein